jgi:hypothetical protein
MPEGRISMVVALVALLAGAALTVKGFVTTDLTILASHLWFLVPALVLIGAIARVTTLSPYLLAAVLACILAVSANVMWSLIVVIGFGLASIVLGDVFLRLIGVNSPSHTERLLAGLGFYGSVVGLIAHFPISYAGAYGVALVLPILLGRSKLLLYWADLKAAFGQQTEDRQPIEEVLVATAIGALALTHFAVALMPELGHDALAMHLFVPGHMAARHQWGFDASTYVWAVMPMLGDWLYTFGYMLAGEPAARLTNLGFILVVGWLVREIALWAGASRRGSAWALLLFLSTPLTFTESSTLFIESSWAAFILCGALSVFRLYSGARDVRSDILLAGLMLGFASATKAVSLTMLPALAVPLLIGIRKWPRDGLMPAIGKGIGLLVLSGGIPYATAWFKTGNPVFPFFNKIFKSPFWPSVNFESPLFQQGFSWDTAYRIAFESGKYLESYPGAGGFQWLLLLCPVLILLAFRKSWAALVLIAVALLGVAMVFHQTSYLRYVFPMLALLCAGIAVVMADTGHWTKHVWWGAGGVAVVLNSMFLFAGSPSYANFSLLGAALSDSARTSFLNSRLPLRNAVVTINQLNDGKSRVAFFSQPMAAGLNSDALYPNWYNHTFQAELFAAKTDGDVAAALTGRGVIYVAADSNWPQWKQFPLLKALLFKITDPVADIGTVSVRRLRSDSRYLTEMLRNPDLATTDGWSIGGTAKHIPESGSVVVTVSSPIAQAIAVYPGRKYMNSVSARCSASGEKTSVRAQVNWLDGSGKFITTNIRTFECGSDWRTEVQEVVAPPDARTAIVYGSGHTEIAIELTSISFRQ